MKSGKNREKIGFSDLSVGLLRGWRRYLMGVILGVVLMMPAACKHTSTDYTYETSRDLEKTSYTPRTQKDVKDLINLVSKPL
jgi:hypothetical protein